MDHLKSVYTFWSEVFLAMVLSLFREKIICNCKKYAVSRQTCPRKLLLNTRLVSCLAFR